MTQRPLALITGASGGIGLELARCFAEGGHDVALVARSVDRLRSLAEELTRAHGVTAHVAPADLARPGAAAELWAELERRGLVVDVLVNNAGFGVWGPFSQADAARQREMIQLNITSLTELLRLALPGMLERRRGRVLNLASTAAFAPGPLMAVYYATKAYVLSLSQAVANEVKDQGVTVSALCPGPTRTDFAAVAERDRSNLFAGPNVLDAATVARAGYRGLLRGTLVIIPGLANKVLAFSTRLSPRWMLLAITRWFQERR